LRSEKEVLFLAMLTKRSRRTRFRVPEIEALSSQFFLQQRRQKWKNLMWILHLSLKGKWSNLMWLFHLSLKEKWKSFHTLNGLILNFLFVHEAMDSEHRIFGSKTCLHTMNPSRQKLK
jgi:hypothetical protein